MSDMRKMLYFSCPKCGLRMAIDIKRSMEKIICKKCKHKFIAASGKDIKFHETDRILYKELTQQICTQTLTDPEPPPLRRRLFIDDEEVYNYNKSMPIIVLILWGILVVVAFYCFKEFVKNKDFRYKMRVEKNQEEPKTKSNKQNIIKNQSLEDSNITPSLGSAEGEKNQTKRKKCNKKNLKLP